MRLGGESLVRLSRIASLFIFLGITEKNGPESAPDPFALKTGQGAKPLVSKHTQPNEVRL